MKVLFAVNNENISETIIKKYQQDYKEIISAKNVYYFNAIIKELQRDKSYDRIVISEDLEPFSNNNYDAIDKFIFEKMDNISDEATNLSGNDIPIILICADRRAKSEPLLIKLFGIGVYNALIGKDRSITTVCELLNRPRTKKEAKVYYRIDSDDVDYKVESEGDVSEVEIQNIVNFYKKLGRNEDKYVESFDHIASQYTDSQLRLIAKFLPLNVKAVLEANSPKYQEVISFGVTGSSASKTQTKPVNNYQTQNIKTAKVKNEIKKDPMNLDLIEKNLSKSKMTEPVIIPSSINTAKVRKIEEVDNILNDISVPTTTKVEEPVIENWEDEEVEDPITQSSNQPVIENIEESEPQEEVLVAQPKRRGRPKKVQPEGISNNENSDTTTKRGRGRPKKAQSEDATNSLEINNYQNANSENIENRMQENTSSAPVNLFELGEEEPNETAPSATTYSDMILPGLDDEEMYEQEENQNDMLTGNSALQQNFEPEVNRMQEMQQPMQPQVQPQPLSANQEEAQPIETEKTLNQLPNFGTATTQAVQNTGKYQLTNVDLSPLLSREKKIVAFVGTSKNGTSFLVNNLAEMFSQKGIKTALIDLTQNKNAYYIYTENEENLRQIAFSSMENLRKGNPQGIQVNKNLTVFTTLPGENEDSNDYARVLETLLKNYSLILLDCDFETNYGYFKEAQEIYLVQTLDVLTIQPLTAFLRDLKAKNVLNPEKIRIALNKVVRVRSVTERTIIGGMAYYNDPAMSFMTELFNKDLVPYCSIPFEEQAYSKYLEGLVNCKISLNGYSKNFMATLNKLGSMVYPLIGNGNNPTPQKGYNNYTSAPVNSGNFPNSMNDTLNKMKNNY